MLRKITNEIGRATISRQPRKLSNGYNHDDGENLKTWFIIE
jgi:hypothetical protein